MSAAGWVVHSFHVYLHFLGKGSTASVAWPLQFASCSLSMEFLCLGS